MDGTFGDEPMGATAATRWLREIFSRHGLDADTQDLATHSAKTTCLSWCSKFGLDPTTRTLLGYHQVTGQSGMMHYSRDALSGPLRLLASVIQAIASGQFSRDSTRSGYFPQGRVAAPTDLVGPAVGAQGTELHIEPEAEGAEEQPEALDPGGAAAASSSESSSSSSSGSGSDLDDEAAPEPAVNVDHGAASPRGHDCEASVSFPGPCKI